MSEELRERLVYAILVFYDEVKLYKQPSWDDPEQVEHYVKSATRQAMTLPSGQLSGRIADILEYIDPDWKLWEDEHESK